MGEAIQLVHSYGGVIAVAHPWYCKDAMKVCEEAVKLGIDGLECFPPEGSPEFGTSRYQTFAHDHNLFCSFLKDLNILK